MKLLALASSIGTGDEGSAVRKYASTPASQRRRIGARRDRRTPCGRGLGGRLSAPLAATSPRQQPHAVHVDLELERAVEADQRLFGTLRHQRLEGGDQRLADQEPRLADQDEGRRGRLRGGKIGLRGQQRGGGFLLAREIATAG